MEPVSSNTQAWQVFGGVLWRALLVSLGVAAAVVVPLGIMLLRFGRTPLTDDLSQELALGGAWLLLLLALAALVVGAGLLAGTIGFLVSVAAALGAALGHRLGWGLLTRLAAATAAAAGASGVAYAMQDGAPLDLAPVGVAALFAAGALVGLVAAGWETRSRRRRVPLTAAEA